MNHFLADSLTINEGGVISVIVIGVLGAKKKIWWIQNKVLPLQL